jgi:hypothetical protein
MTTIARRTFRSSPYRDAAETWDLIVALLTRGRNVSAKTELDSVQGIAASVIADRGPEKSPIVVTCEGPRTRIYCIYDENAIDGSDSQEDALGYDPLTGDWSISLPCTTEDLGWVQTALVKTTQRVKARRLDASIDEAAAPRTTTSLSIDLEGFLRK